MERITTDIQGAFDHLQAKVADLQQAILDVNTRAIAGISTGKMVLQALMDLGFIMPADLRAGLEHLRDDDELGETNRLIFQSMIIALCPDQGQSPPPGRAKHLRIVSSSDQD